VFGIRVFGADYRTFLEKYPGLGKACGNPLRTLTVKCEYPNEQAVLQALEEFDMEEPDAAVCSSGLGCGGSSEGGFGGKRWRRHSGGGTECGDREGMEVDDGDDIGGEIGDDLPMSGIE